MVGGVMSGIGKGISTASIGKILQAKGYRVTAVKIDPYINVDAGTMNPIEHGEVFVTEDGDETDQDIGNYERFLDKELLSENYMTTGRVYQSVINRERNLEYGGKCVEVVPHVPEEIIHRIECAAKSAKADFVLIEIGGTVGEYQNLIFLEAARMMRLANPRDVLFVLVSYLPVPSKIGEMKTKPTQYAARSLNTAGIQPDIIIARSDVPLDPPRKQKISIFCNVSPEDVISAPDVESIYEVPLNFEREQLGKRIMQKFNLPTRVNHLRQWKRMVDTAKDAKKTVRIAMIGKYFATGAFVLSDAYISVIEAVKHAAWHWKRKPLIQWLNAELYEKDLKRVRELSQFDGIIVPGGFGGRGIGGKLAAIEFARRSRIPYLGLCYGMQLAVIEFARNVCGLKEANTTEINSDTPHPVIHVMADQESNLRERRYGGSMRLGAYPCQLTRGTRSYKAYGAVNIIERHRHRYEFNNEYRDAFETRGFVVAGVNKQRNLVEIVELKNHPFFVGTQFHPELKSRPLRPHPLFREFIAAAIKR